MGLHKFFHQMGVAEAAEFHLTIVMMIVAMFVLNFATFVLILKIWKRQRQLLALQRS